LTRIHILLARRFPVYGHSAFYPLVKWRNEFFKKTISFRFFRNHLHKRLLDCDCLIIDWRYIDLIQKGRYQPKGSDAKDIAFVRELLRKASSSGVRTVLYDSSDAAGTRAFSVLPHVDVWLKKQLFKDVETYTESVRENQYMSWLPDQIGEVPKYRGKTVAKSDVKKLRLGWNIGMSDYRYFPEFVYRLRLGTSNYFPQHYRMLRTMAPLGGGRPYIFSYRGSLKGNKRYAFSRRALLNELEQSKGRLAGDYILGGKTSKNEYLNELRSSKVGISPFGWGEICYRDFEIIQNGALLVKPSVEHLQTWPDLFVSGETYVPIDWEYASLVETLNYIEKNLDEFRPVAKRAQDVFLHHQMDHQGFIEHFREQLGV
jgi:hypothetical protein